MIELKFVNNVVWDKSFIKIYKNMAIFAVYGRNSIVCYGTMNHVAMGHFINTDNKVILS